MLKYICGEVMSKLFFSFKLKILGCCKYRNAFFIFRNSYHYFLKYQDLQSAQWKVCLSLATSNLTKKPKQERLNTRSSCLVSFPLGMMIGTLLTSRREVNIFVYMLLSSIIYVLVFSFLSIRHCNCCKKSKYFIHL